MHVLQSSKIPERIVSRPVPFPYLSVLTAPSISIFSRLLNALRFQSSLSLIEYVNIWHRHHKIVVLHLGKAREEDAMFGLRLRRSQLFFFCHGRLLRNLRRKSGEF